MSEKPYQGVLRNAVDKDLFGGTLTCFLNTIGANEFYEERLPILKQVIEIGIRKKFDVNGHVKEILSVFKEGHDEEFMKRVMTALKTVHAQIKDK